MDAARWARVKALFHGALAVPPADRDAWLVAACAGDSDLHAEAARLVAAHEGDGAWLDQGALAGLPATLGEHLTADVPDGLAPGTRLGPWEVVAEIGRGGMGTVVRARRADGAFAGEVAIKLIGRGLDRGEIKRRFLAERRVLARLVHPHIARLLDAGSSADGRPYLVLEYVPGLSITDYCTRHALPVAARVALVRAVADAVMFAHRNLVVHRDLKPANVLVGEDGVPKLLDFGIAKLLAADTDEAPTALTVAGYGPMTPEYASPEQLAGGAVTTATDVYGLGRVLHEVLVGRRPAVATTGGGWPRPSRLVSRELAREIAGDLDAVVGRCLELDPEDRYGSVAELVADLDAYLLLRPVAARRAGWRERAGKFVRRHPAGTAALAAMVALAAVAAWQGLRAAQERDRAEAEARRARAVKEYLVGLFEAADPNESRGEAPTVRQVLERGAARLDQSDLAAEPALRGDLWATVGRVYAQLGSTDAARDALFTALALQGTGDRPAERLARAETLLFLGHVARRRERWVEAEQHYEASRALAAGLPGVGDLARANAHNGLGLLFQEQRDFARAAREYQTAVDLFRLAENPGRALAQALNNLAAVTIDHGQDAARAEVLLGEALALLAARGEQESPLESNVRVNLGGALVAQGRLDEARRQLQWAVALRRKLLPPDHPDLGSALTNLGVVALRSERPDEARSALTEALAVFRRRPGESTGAFLNAARHLAELELAAGDGAAAETLFLEARERGRQAGTVGVPLAQVVLGLAELRFAAGEAEPARELAAEVEAALNTESEATFDVGASWLAVGWVWHRLGDFPRAVGAYRRGAAVGQASGDAELEAKSRRSEGWALLDAGRLAEAQPVLAVALALYRERVTVPAKVGFTEALLGRCLVLSGEVAAGRELLTRGHAAVVAALGPDAEASRQIAGWRREAGQPP
ncbi:MAG: serine/threonine-protein kinase [Thermoanaerobaculia bacterium]|nr:serine/threonine-protein kinase [Thermoanaerobaculia bacterium]